MKKQNLKVGDRVIPHLTTTNPPLRFEPGMLATITNVDHFGIDGSRHHQVTITFDRNVGGHGPGEKNWYVLTEECELLVEAPIRDYVFVGQMNIQGHKVEMTAATADILFDIADKLGGHEQTRLVVSPRSIPTNDLI